MTTSADMDALETAPLLGDGARRAEALIASVLANGAPQQRGRALLRRAELELVRGDTDDAVQDALAAVERLEGVPLWHERAALLAARLLNRTLRRERAEQLIREIAPRARGLDEGTRLALFMAEGEVALDAKRDSGAREAFLEAIKLSEKQPHELLQAATCLCMLDQLQGDTQGALTWATRALETAEAHGDARWVANSAFTSANLALRLAEPARARRLLERALATRALDKLFVPPALELLARLRSEAGEHEAALRAAVAAARQGAALSNAAAFADGTALSAQLLLKLGRREEALEALDAGARVLESRSESGLAELLRRDRREMRAPATTSTPEPR